MAFTGLYEPEVNLPDGTTRSVSSTPRRAVPGPLAADPTVCPAPPSSHPCDAALSPTSRTQPSGRGYSERLRRRDRTSHIKIISPVTSSYGRSLKHPLPRWLISTRLRKSLVGKLFTLSGELGGLGIAAPLAVVADSVVHVGGSSPASASCRRRWSRSKLRDVQVPPRRCWAGRSSGVGRWTVRGEDRRTPFHGCRPVPRRHEASALGRVTRSRRTGVSVFARDARVEGLHHGRETT